MYMGKITKTYFTFGIDHADQAAIRKLSKETGAPVAELIRRAIRAYLSGQVDASR